MVVRHCRWEWNGDREWIEGVRADKHFGGLMKFAGVDKSARCGNWQGWPMQEWKNAALI